jgi:integrase
MPRVIQAPERAPTGTRRDTNRAPAQPPSGHVFRVDRKRGPVWYAKYRLPDGRQLQRKLGPAWTERGRPPAGYYTKRMAEDQLRDLLDEARRGTLPGLVRTGATVEDATEEYLRYIEHDRERKPSTVQGYRWIVNGQILPTFGQMRLEEVTSEHVEHWLAGIDCKASTRTKALVILHGVFQRARKAYKLPANPVTDVEKPPLTRSGDIVVFSPEEVWALVRAADSEQDGAIFLTAAFTGLRQGELIALHWRDVDFTGSLLRVRASYAGGALTTPKSGKVRSVPLAPEVAKALAQLSQRELFTGEDDLVFPGPAGGFLDGSALRRRYKAALKEAQLRSLRFHDLRHTFGTRMIAKADIRRVQEWMGHADIQTTMRYLHYAPREEDAQLVAEAFRVREAGDLQQPVKDKR